MTDASPVQMPIPVIWWLPYNLYKWLVIVPVLLLSTLLLGSLIIVLSMLGLANFSSRIFATFWARLNATVMMMSVSIEGREHLQPGQSFVLAANHSSLVDIYVLYGIPWLDLKWVMKKELRKVPVLGHACDMMGHIYVDRSSGDKALQSLIAARGRVKDGICVVFFPEGTRSRTSEIGAFKKGAFRMAKELDIPVVPVSIHNTSRVLPPGSLDWRPGKVRLVFHRPLPVNDSTDINHLAIETRNIIADSLMDCPEVRQ